MGARADPPVRALQAGLLVTGLVLGLLAGLDPAYAAIAALGLGFVVLVLADLTIGLCIFTVISFLDLLPFGGVTLTFAKAAGLLLAISWLATLTTSSAARSDFFAAHPAVSYVLFAFLSWTALSIVWAEDPGAGFESFYRYGLNIVLLLIVFTAVQRSRHAIWVVGAFLVGALISALYGIASPAETVGPEDIARLSGAGADPNELAASLVAALPLAAAFLVSRHRSPGVRLLAATAIVVCSAGVLLSFSRTGLVSLAVVLVAAVVFGGRWRLPALALLAAVCIGIGGYLAFSATPEQRERVTKLDGGTGRSDIWAVGWRMIQDSPSNGIGAGNFPVASVHYLLEPGAIERAEFIVDTPKVAHNLYLEVWAELGLIGLALFLTIIGFGLSSTFRAVRLFKRTGDDDMELLSRALLVSLLGFLAAGMFLSEQFSKQLWLLLALGPCLLAIAVRREQEGE